MEWHLSVVKELMVLSMGLSDKNHQNTLIPGGKLFLFQMLCAK